MTCRTLKTYKTAQCPLSQVDYVKGVFLCKIKASDGTFNEFPSVDDITDEEILSRLTQTDQSKKFFYIESLEDMVFEESENSVQTFKGGGEKFLSDGTLSWTGLATNQTFGGAAALRAFARENGWGIFPVDRLRNLVSYSDKATCTTIRPIPIMSISNQLMGLDDGRGQQGTIKITIDDSVDFDMISVWSDDDYPADLSNVTDLTSVTGKLYGTPTATQFEMHMFINDGKRIYDDSFDDSYLTLADETGTPIVVSSVAFNSATKRYTVTIPAQTPPVTITQTWTDQGTPKVYSFSDVNQVKVPILS